MTIPKVHSDLLTDVVNEIDKMRSPFRRWTKSRIRGFWAIAFFIYVATFLGFSGLGVMHEAIKGTNVLIFAALSSFLSVAAVFYVRFIFELVSGTALLGMKNYDGEVFLVAIMPRLLNYMEFKVSFDLIEFSKSADEQDVRIRFPMHGKQASLKSEKIEFGSISDLEAGKRVEIPINQALLKEVLKRELAVLKITLMFFHAATGVRKECRVYATRKHLLDEGFEPLLMEGATRAEVNI